MADLYEVAVHDADGGEERLVPVLLRRVETENFLHSIGAVILADHLSLFFLHNFPVREAVKIILQICVNCRIKIIENRQALLDMPHPQVAALREFGSVRDALLHRQKLAAIDKRLFR